MRNRSLLGLVFFLLCGCVAKEPPIDLRWTGQQLLDRVIAQQKRYQSLKGTARLRIATEDKTQSATQALVMQRPDLFRADVISPFGQSMLQIAVQEGRIEAYVPGKRDLYRGQATAENLQRFTRIPLQISDLLSFGLYAAPLWSQTADSIEVDGDRILVRVAAEELKQTLYFNRRGQLVGSDYWQGGEQVLSVVWQNFDQVAPDFPAEVILDLPLTEVRAELSYRQVQLNPVVADTAFKLSPPASVTVRPLP